MNDLVSPFRQLLDNTGFAATVAVLTLALGITGEH